jgi:hypothetical protein
VFFPVGISNRGQFELHFFGTIDNNFVFCRKMTQKIENKASENKAQNA